MSFILKHNGQAVDINYIQDAINCLGIVRFCEINDWAADIAEDFLKSTKAPVVANAERVVEAEYQKPYKDDLYTPLHNMYRFKKKHEVMWRKERRK